MTRRCRRCRKPFEVASTGRPRQFCSKACRDLTSRARLRGSVHFSSATAEWATPQELVDELNREFGFELDVCATAGNAKCGRYFTQADDGLAQAWRGVCWMNPPYGAEIARWVRKAHESSLLGATVVCLLPARTDTRWWQDVCTQGEVRFLRGRVRFGSSGTGAPFPSAVVVFRPPFSRLPGVGETVGETGSSVPSSVTGFVTPRTSRNPSRNSLLEQS